MRSGAVDADKMAELYEAGWTLQEIADHMAYSLGGVYKKLKVHTNVQIRSRNGYPRKGRIPAHEIRRTEQLRQEGHTLKEMSEILGLTEGTISVRLKNLGYGCYYLKPRK